LKKSTYAVNRTELILIVTSYIRLQIVFAFLLQQIFQILTAIIKSKSGKWQVCQT